MLCRYTYFIPHSQMNVCICICTPKIWDYSTGKQLMNLHLHKKFKVCSCRASSFTKDIYYIVNGLQVYAARWVNNHILAGGSQENNVLFLNQATSEV